MSHIKSPQANYISPGFKIKQQKCLFDFLDSAKLNKYRLEPTILNLTEITNINRAVFRNWLCSNCAKSCCSKRTASLACYYVDLFFQKKNKCELQTLVNFGFACLNIANKSEDNRPIKFLLTKDEFQYVNQLEQELCFKLSFDLTPITYSILSESLILLWQRFCQMAQDRMENTQSCTPPQILLFNSKANFLIANYSFNLLEQFLEFVFHNVQSFRYDLDSLVFNSFYLILCVVSNRIQSYLNKFQIDEYFFQNKECLNLMESFSKFCVSQSYLIASEISCPIGMFLYKMYNSLISQFDQTKEKNEKKNFFDPNEEKWAQKNLRYRQTHLFTDKEDSMRLYLERKQAQEFRNAPDKVNAIVSEQGNILESPRMSAQQSFKQSPQTAQKLASSGRKLQALS